MKKILLSLIVLLSGITNAWCQQPMELAQQIFGTDTTFNVAAYSTGEYDGHPNGQDIAKDAIRRFLLLTQTDDMAVVAMSLTDSTGYGVDTYLHFVKKDTWKLAAFRALALTNVIERSKEELEKLTPAQIKTRFRSEADYDYLLGNAELTLEMDTNIIDYFNENRKAFEALKDSLIKVMPAVIANEENPITIQEKFLPAAKKLYMSNIHLRRQGYIEFVIGGITDNLVGYLYVKDKRKLPEMDPANIIMIREIGDGWYIFKTT
jgi:hypothetical protein